MTSSGRLGNVTGALLLGGRSRRMGRDKAHLVRDGVTWSTQTAALLDSLFEETLLVGGAPEAAAPGRRVADPEGPDSAMRGFVGALSAAHAERVLVVATDLPLLGADLLLALTAWPEADAVVPSDASGSHPLCALYRREKVLTAARERLAEGRLGMRALLDELETDFVDVDDFGIGDVAGQSLRNINSPDDLAALGGA